MKKNTSKYIYVFVLNESTFPMEFCSTDLENLKIVITTKYLKKDTWVRFRGYTVREWLGIAENSEYGDVLGWIKRVPIINKGIV